VVLKRRRLMQRRKALGHTQDDLAALVGVDRTTVIRWERAERDPQPWLRHKLAVALRVSADELTELLDAVSEVPARADGYTLLSSVPLDFSDASAAVSLAEGFSAHDLASRRQVLERLSVLGSAALLKPIRQWVASLPAERPGPISPDDFEELRAKLLPIMAELAQLAGWMAYDLGLPGAAQRYYLLALHACREAGSSALPLASKLLVI
jgi:DNA-binding XRE family transcriptional regulator